MSRAEELLHEGLAIAEVSDIEQIADRLADLYEEQGQLEEAAKVKQQARVRSQRVVQQRHEIELDG